MATSHTPRTAAPADPRNRFSAASPAPDIGSVIARVFDVLEGSRLEPFAAQVASSIVNGPRRSCRA